MTKAEILAALKQLLSKADFTAAMNDLAVWVQGKFTTLKGLIEDNVVSVTEAANATSGSVKTFDVQNAKGVSLGKVEVPADLSDYDNTTSDFQSGAEVDAKIAAEIGKVYKPAGSLAAAGVVPSLLVAANLGKVYNLSEDVTTDSDWVDGAGHTVKAGTNIVIAEVDNEGTPAYKFDALTFALDLSNYLQPEDFETVGATEAKAIVAAAIAAAEAPAQSGD